MTIMNIQRENPAFAVYAPSDTANDSHLWRDAWVKDALMQELQLRGHSYSYVNPDVSIYIWGWITKPLNPGSKNILWVIGHPDLLEANIEQICMVQWAGVYCSSLSYQVKLSKMLDRDVEYLVCPGADRQRFSHKPEFDLSFVGNCDPAKGRPGLIPIFNRFSSNVVGNFPGAQLQNIAWNGMQDVFNSAKLFPYSHHTDMAKEGFVADTALDVMKNSGALVLSDSNPGFDDLNIEVPQWSRIEDLYSMIPEYLDDYDLRLELVTKCRVAAGKFTMAHVAEKLETHFE